MAVIETFFLNLSPLECDALRRRLFGLLLTSLFLAFVNIYIFLYDGSTEQM